MKNLLIFITFVTCLMFSSCLSILFKDGVVLDVDSYSLNRYTVYFFVWVNGNVSYSSADYNIEVSKLDSIIKIRKIEADSTFKILKKYNISCTR